MGLHPANGPPNRHVSGRASEGYITRMASWTAYVVAALVAVPAVLLGLDRAVQPRDWSDATIFYPERFHGPEVSAAGWYFEGCEGSYPTSHPPLPAGSRACPPGCSCFPFASPCRYLFLPCPRQTFMIGIVTHRVLQAGP